MNQTDIDALARTDAALRQLLIRIFDTNRLYTFEELVSDIATSIEFKFDCLVCVRERSWFQPNRPFLVFPYLTFSYVDKVAERFENADEVIEREKQLASQGFRERSSDLCMLRYKADPSLNVDRVVNLLMRIVVSFYKNCGYHDHFRTSVAGRFVREYFRGEPKRGVGPMLDYIEQKIGVGVTLWKPRDEMFFSQPHDRPIHDLLRPFPGTNYQPLSQFSDNEFARSLEASVLRKNQTCGVAEKDQRQFVIKTFSRSRMSGVGSESRSNYKVRQEAVAVFEPLSNERINLDAVFHAGRVIETYLDACDDLKVADVLMNAEKRCVAMESGLAESPLKSTGSFLHELSEVLAPTMDEVAAVTEAGAIALWLHEPFASSLLPILTRCYDERFTELATLAPIDLESPSTHLVKRCFENMKEFHLIHPEFVESELRLVDQFANRWSESERASRRIRCARYKEERAAWEDSSATRDCACLVVPVRRGPILVGVLEVVSSEVGQLTIDTALLERLAGICGETLRRLELANDRAWLARMSFVYACRHKIEALVREFEVQAPEAAKELAVMITDKRATAETIGKSLQGISKAASLTRIRDALNKHCDFEAVDKWVDTLNRVMTEVHAEDFAYECVADITETLMANTTHSEFLIEAYRVSYRRGDSHVCPCVEIMYEPRETWIDEKRMDQIGVSPIESGSSLTSHYGLFLLSAHIRMLGGFVQPRNIANDIGCKLFGLAFKLPAHTARGT